MRQMAQEELDLIISANCSSAFAFDCPVFSAWLVDKTKDVSAILGEAMALREEADFVAARTQLRELRLIIESADPAEASRKAQAIQKQLTSVFGRIRKNFGISTGQGIPINTVVKVYNAAASFAPIPTLPETELSLRYPEFIDSWMSKAGFAAVYRDVVRDLTTTERLGALRSLLGAKVNKVDEPAYVPRTEDPKYRYSHSQWKSPM